MSAIASGREQQVEGGQGDDEGQECDLEGRQCDVEDRYGEDEGRTELFEGFVTCAYTVVLQNKSIYK